MICGKWLADCLKRVHLNLPNNRRVLPLPSFPQTRLNSPVGKLRLRSTSTNLCLGVEAAEGVLLPIRERSCGHVTVADWRAIIWLCWDRGGTVDTSVPCRYFSIRRRETRLCFEESDEHMKKGIGSTRYRTWSILISVSGRAFSANFISENTRRPCQCWHRVMCQSTAYLKSTKDVSIS